jgi:hypothetical protein
MVAGGGRLGVAAVAHQDDLRAVAGGDAGRDEVGAFRQEGAFTLAELAEPQTRRPLDDGVLHTGDGFA